jgi:hypothetical protein
MFCVRWASTFSEFFYVTNGVRQGGIMSPVLFNVYMNDLSVRLNASKCGCNINGSFINHLMYADDSCVIAPSPSALQRLLDICNSFAYENSIIYNEQKTKCMFFKSSTLGKLFVPSVYLNGKPLDYVTSQKYLGINITNDLSDDSDIIRQVKALYVRGNMLVHKFNHCSDDVKRSLFRSYCSNVYGSQLWSQYKKESYRRVNVAYNNIYRKLFHIKRGESISAGYVTNNIDCFNVLVRKHVFAFRLRICASSNVLLDTIVSSAFYKYGSKLTTKWNHILYTFNM